MTQLLVDIGNTRLKWGICQGSEITCGRPFVHHQLEQKDLFESWKKISTTPESLAISCVSSKQPLERVRTVAAALWPNIEIIQAQSSASAFGVCNAYKHPEKLGVDRWLSLIAVRQQYAGSVCIVDCGTAITIDLMDAQGHHQGGLISPGLKLMKKSLTQGTDALPLSEKIYPMCPANDTEAAIYSGTLSAAAGLIEHCLIKEENRLLILTGGDAEIIAEQLSHKPIIDTDLVLRGLAIVLAGHV